MAVGSVEPMKLLHARHGDHVRFLDVVIRQAHPGGGAPPYGSLDEKREDAARYVRDYRIPWTVLVDDLEGTVHQVYGRLTDPVYLIDRDGRVAFYDLWTNAPALDAAIARLERQAVAVLVLVSRGFSARDEPLAGEAWAARQLRTIATPRHARELGNPLPLTDYVLDHARRHFADHCAICHANDGSGRTELGMNMYPKPPDMRLESTQSLSDGELFYIIENGIRFTGMPTFDHDEEGTWELVHFIRHLPDITAGELAEMERYNPRSLEAWRQLMKDDVADAPRDEPHDHPH